MTIRVPPFPLRVVGVLLFGTLMMLRAEVASRLVSSLLAGIAFGTLAMVWRLPWRPVRLSVRFFHSKTTPANPR